ncbi:FAD-dependent oxidoreductase [Streptomyces sp. NPDC059788]|uniref:FAD-dependent oxidoreductase n=1 Tax=Streptomyces sp. NPDC059788 TaxID=3346948 RepID=UPI00365EEDB9
MRAAIVGGGLAGAALGWRLAQRGASVTVFVAGAGRWRDATGASGGLVRGFDTDPDAGRLAAESLAELRGDPRLRDWAGYQEGTSTYLLPPDADVDRARGTLRTVDALLPGSAELRPAAGLAPFRGLPEGTWCVRERHAGHVSPGRLRDSLLRAVADLGGTLRCEPVLGVLPGPALRLGLGVERRYDAVVLATGPWTPHLLDRWGLPDQGLSTRQIQYTLGRTVPRGLGAFVDETSGLYGRPVGTGQMLLGLPTTRWGVGPDEVARDPALARRVAECAGLRLGLTAWPGPGARTVASLDCYPVGGRGGLALRGCRPDSALYTFAGGGGGAAKTALAAGRLAARTLCSA